MTKWGLSQQCKFGLTSENLLIYYAILKKKGEKPYIHFNRLRKGI